MFVNNNFLKIICLTGLLLFMDLPLVADNLTRSEYIDAIMLLKHKKVNYRRRGALVLNNCRDRNAVPHLINALSDPDYLVRKRAATSLVNVGNVNDKLTVPALAESLAGETDEEAYSAKVYALAHFSGHKSTLAEITNVYNAMTEEDREKMLYFFHDLVKQNKAAFENLRSLYKEALEYGTPKCRLLALSAFGANGNVFDRDLLIKYATHSDINTRLISLQYLEKFEDNEVIVILRKACEDVFPLIRTEALTSLAAHKNIDNFNIFVKACKDGSPLVRRVATMALGLLQNHEGFTILRHLLLDADRGVRLEAAHSLALMDQHAGFDILVHNMRENSDKEERRIAAHGLYVLKSRHAAEHFQSVLRDRDLQVRRIAQKALKELNIRARY